MPNIYNIFDNDKTTVWRRGSHHISCAVDRRYKILKDFRRLRIEKKMSQCDDGDRILPFTDATSTLMKENFAREKVVNVYYILCVWKFKIADKTDKLRIPCSSMPDIVILRDLLFGVYVYYTRIFFICHILHSFIWFIVRLREDQINKCNNKQ